MRLAQETLEKAASLKIPIDSHFNKPNPESYIQKNFLVGLKDGNKKELFNITTLEEFSTFKFNLINTIDDFNEAVFFRYNGKNRSTIFFQQCVRDVLFALKSFQKFIHDLPYTKFIEIEMEDSLYSIEDSDSLISIPKKEQKILNTIQEETESINSVPTFKCL